MRAIVLGTGHLPSDLRRVELLDVTLHLDESAQPLSLGVRWGGHGTAASYSLKDATAPRHHDHLRACGCEWLRDAARAEWLAGRTLTPAELLARRPAPPHPQRAAAAAPPDPQRRAVAAPPDPQRKARCEAALRAGDYARLEALRDDLDDALVRALVDGWRPDLPWDLKDAYAALLMDQLDPSVHPLFHDALDSPTVETRAYAVCVLSGDLAEFEDLLVDGHVDPARVDAAVAALRRAG